MRQIPLARLPDLHPSSRKGGIDRAEGALAPASFSWLHLVLEYRLGTTDLTRQFLSLVGVFARVCCLLGPFGEETVLDECSPQSPASLD